MNWKLIFTLSLFGLAMAISTVYWIPSSVEWVFWLVIFLICGYRIARQSPGKFFLHGFLVSLVNCFWITTAHVLLYDSYITTHAEEAKMLSEGPMANHPRMMLLIMGPIIGIISGVVLGLFSFITAKILKK